MQDTNHLKRLNELLKNSPEMKKRSLNYVNYTKENYNILTLEKHNNYYQNYRQKVPVYVREQPNWSKSLYKRKNNKINNDNYIIFRNVQNIKQGKTHFANSSIVPRDSLYRHNKSSYEPSDKGSVTGFASKKRSGKTIERERSVAETLPLINKKGTTISQHSCYNSKTYKRSNMSRTNGSQVDGKIKLSEAEQLIKRAEQLGRFVQTIKTEEGKEMVKVYGKQLIEKLKASDITKERMKIAMITSADNLQKVIEENLGIKLDIDTEKKEEVDEEPKDETLKEITDNEKT